MQKKDQVLTNVANLLLSNEITFDDLNKLYQSVEPNGSRWLLYQTKQILEIDISLDIANIIKEYASKIQIYDITKSGSYKIPYSFHKHCNETQFTFSFWCKPKELNRYQTMITTEPLDSRQRKYGWGFRFRRENIFMFYVMSGHGYSALSLKSKTKLDETTINKWYYITGVYNGLNGVAKLYINGVLENQQTVNKNVYPLIFTSKRDLQIGSLVNGGEGFNGLLFDFVMYNKLMSKEEINRCYKSMSINICDEKSIVLKSNDMINWKYKQNEMNEWTNWVPQIRQLMMIELNDLFV
eukprot:478148_1